MTSKLGDLFAAKTDRNADLRTLMLKCQTRAQEIYVVCIGAGDAFITRYWPVLQRHAAQWRLRLMVADQKPLALLAEEKVKQAKESEDEKAQELEKLYNSFIHAVNAEDRVIFSNISDERDGKWYQQISADIVLILVPDIEHVNKAREWLKRSTLIFIEKPYNRLLEEAQQFVTDLQSMINHIGGDVPATWVCSFDHYLAKISEYVFNKEKANLLERIGPLTGVDFAILEAGPVEPWRAESLKAGMIYDLFSHVLAMASVELDLSTFHDDRVEDIGVAHHPRFDSDTFARFRFALLDYQHRPIKVSGEVGKGVGDKDEKFLTFTGQRGSIRCDLDPKGPKKKPIMINENGNERPMYEVGRGHDEFLKTLLEGRYIEEPMGGLTNDAAIKILRIINSIRERIPSSIAEYDVRTPKDQVIKRATRLPFGRRKGKGASG